MQKKEVEKRIDGTTKVDVEVIERLGNEISENRKKLTKLYSTIYAIAQLQLEHQGQQERLLNELSIHSLYDL